MSWKSYRFCGVFLLFFFRRGDQASTGDIIQSVCPNGTFRVNDSCFRFFGERKTWDQSNKHCHDVMGGHLAIVNTAEIFNQLKTISLKHNSEIIWIGSKVTHGKQITWVDGKQCCSIFWVPGQLDHPGSGVCLELWRNNAGQIGFDETHACPDIPNCQRLKCSSSIVSVCNDCKHGFIPVKNASVCFDMESQTHVKCYQSCLVVFTDLSTWGDANEVCKVRSGHLYVPDNLNEDQFLRNYLEAVISTDRNFWIGGQLLQSLKTMWLSEMLVDGERWGHKPSNSSEDKCIALNPNDKFKLTALNCNEEMFFICEEKTLYDPNLIG